MWGRYGSGVGAAHSDIRIWWSGKTEEGPFFEWWILTAISPPGLRCDIRHRRARWVARACWEVSVTFVRIFDGRLLWNVYKLTICRTGTFRETAMGISPITRSFTQLIVLHARIAHKHTYACQENLR